MYPLVVQPLYIGADHPSYLCKKVHKIFVFMYFRPKTWILQVHFAPYSVSHFPPVIFFTTFSSSEHHHLMGGVLCVINLR